MELRNGVLVVGGSGQLGIEIVAAFAAYDVIAPSHAELPIENHEAFDAFLAQVSPSLVINCSAFHQVDQCEAAPQKAFEVNATAVAEVAAACARRGIAFATFSTDYVFAGEQSKVYFEDDLPQPKNVYGASKLAGEHLVMARNANAFVFRTSGVFGRTGFSNKGPTFVERMISMAEDGKPISVVDNIVFSPSYTCDVADSVRQIISRESSGLFHVTNSGKCSWYDLAEVAIRTAGLTASITRTSYDASQGVARPIYSPMDSRRFENGYDRLPSWESAVERYVDLRRQRAAAKS